MSSHMLKKGTVWATLFTYMATFMLPAAHAAPGILANTPLFISSPVKPNIMLSLDDSGSMDGEVLMLANDGALWWNTADESFVGRNKNDAAVPGVINYNNVGDATATWKKYVYLFPNGSGTTSSGQRVYADAVDAHYAIPPTADYAFTRSPDYNAAYYNPGATYIPWVSYGALPATTFGNANPTKAPHDPVYNPTTVFMDLTTPKAATATAGWTFKVHKGMKRSNGNVATADLADGAAQAAFAYDPATYYLKDPSLTFTYNGIARTYGDPTNYTDFVKGTGTKAGTADAIGPDGAFLKKYTIPVTDTAKMQNFANWFTYYRKRHSAMRGGVGHAFKDMTNIRTGLFRINNRVAVTMLDFDTQRDTFYSTLYGMVGNGGTPNREALDFAGQQFQRTNAGAPILAQCQVNAAIAFTDGFSNATTGLGGGADNIKAVPYKDSYNDTIADIAMKYYSSNLRPDLLAGKVPVSPLCKATPLDPQLDCNTDLHMNTYGVTLGTQGNIFGVTHNTVDDAYATPPAWVNPTLLRNPVQVDDLYHAAINGRGDMLNARTPGEIQDKMQSVLETILDRTGSAAAVAFNSTALSTNSVVYQARFNMARWSGELLAYKLDANNGKIGRASCRERV